MTSIGSRSLEDLNRAATTNHTTRNSQCGIRRRSIHQNMPQHNTLKKTVHEVLSSTRLSGRSRGRLFFLPGDTKPTFRRVISQRPQTSGCSTTWQARGHDEYTSIEHLQNPLEGKHAEQVRRDRSNGLCRNEDRSALNAQVSTQAAVLQLGAHAARERSVSKTGFIVLVATLNAREG